MIIIDYSQLCIATYMVAIGKYTNSPIELDLIRHMILNSIRSVNHRFKNEFGNIVIAVDDGNSWRRDIFPYYKANRKVARDKSDIDWSELYSCIGAVRTELEEHFPYVVIKVANAEADDVIGTLARHCVQNQEHVLIISGDKDFIQLQADNIFVKQWDNAHQRWVSHAEPKRYLFEHVIKGDMGDGIPNVYSQDDHYITKAARAKPVRTKALEEMWAGGVGELTSSPQFKRNITLIDLKRTPAEIQSEILNRLQNYPKKAKSGLMTYFMKHQLKQLSTAIGEF